MINIKDLWNVFNEAGKIEEYQKILNLIDDQFRMREQIDNFKKEITTLRSRLEIKESLEFKNNAYYLKNGDGPFCQACWDNNEKLIRIIKYPFDKDSYDCKVCKNSIRFSGNIEPFSYEAPPTEY